MYSQNVGPSKYEYQSKVPPQLLPRYIQRGPGSFKMYFTVADIQLDTLNWPPKGTDMNPIENVWTQMVRIIQEGPLASFKINNVNFILQFKAGLRDAELGIKSPQLLNNR